MLLTTDGLMNKQIAWEPGIAEATIKIAPGAGDAEDEHTPLSSSCESSSLNLIGEDTPRMQY